jgi:antitoxin (DNA-binding transcriptional repressor) of toxin-antitoxin stability system
MPTMNMRELRDTRKLKAWLRAGKSIELRDRNQVVGRIVPETKAPAPKELPDFEARRKKLFGDRVFNADDFLQDRHGRY